MKKSVLIFLFLWVFFHYNNLSGYKPQLQVFQKYFGVSFIIFTTLNNSLPKIVIVIYMRVVPYIKRYFQLKKCVT